MTQVCWVCRAGRPEQAVPVGSASPGSRLELADLLADILPGTAAADGVLCGRCAGLVEQYDHLCQKVLETKELVARLYNEGLAVKQECTECGKVFGSRSLLRKHKTAAHLRPKQLDCRECNKTYKTAKSLARHMAGHAVRPEDTRCEHCQRKFKTRRQYAKHQFTVHGLNVPVDCDQCMPARTFESEKELARHKAEVHSLRASCHHCGKVYFSATILDNHIRRGL